jgi:hypothetical protein
MQFELQITAIDLKIILNNLISTEHSIAVKRANLSVLQDCVVIDYNEKEDNVSVVSEKSGKPIMEIISIPSIELIEFDFFYTYKGYAAKSFVVQ